MNFISKIIRKPGETEPQLKQAHTGDALAARYDEVLKRWIFPGEENVGAPQELAPPPMMNAPAGSAVGPKRFSLGGRALYTDPFADLQSSRQAAPRLSATVAFDLFPRSASMDLSAFPVDESDQNFNEQKTELYDERGLREVQPSDSTPGWSESTEPAEQIMQRTVTEQFSQRSSREQLIQRTDQFTQRVVAPGSEQLTQRVMIQRDVVSNGGQTPDIAATHRVGSVGSLSSIRGGPTPRTSPPDETKLGEMSRIDTVEDPGLTVISGVSRLNSLAGPTDTWFDKTERQEEEEFVQEESGPQSVAEISILGHPTEAGPITFPSKGRPDPFMVHVDVLSSSSSGVLAVRSAIAECLVAVSGHPANRALFCEAVEAASFVEGPLREAAGEATSVLLSCLDESDEDDRTATIAALGALWNISISRRKDMPDIASVIRSTRKAMTMYPCDAEVQTNALGVLVSLAGDRSAQRQIVHMGCIDLVAVALRTHKQVDLIVEHACQLLAMLNKELRALVPAGYMKLATDAAASSSDPSVQRWGVWLSSKR